MSRKLVILVLLVTVAAALPSPEDIQAKIIRYENDNDGTGNYHFSFETSNGLSREETGMVVNRGQDDEHIEVRGNYKYIDESGFPVTVTYTADKDGFHIVSTQPDLQPFVISLPGAAVATLLG